MPDLTSLFGLKDTWDDDHMDDFSDFGSPGGGAGGPVDFFGDDDYSGGGGGMGFDDGASTSGGVFGGGDLRPSTSANGALGLAQPGENLAPFDPRRQGGEMVMALTGNDEGEGMFDYFDKGFGKRGWAGAEHWKLRKVAKKGEYWLFSWEGTGSA